MQLVFHRYVSANEAGRKSAGEARRRHRADAPSDPLKSFTISQLTDGTAIGTYDVQFKNGDSLTGTFNATECAGATLGEALDAGACQAR